MKKIAWMAMIFGLAGNAWGQVAEKVTAPAFTNQPKTRVSIDSAYLCAFTAMDSADVPWSFR
jgi:hypothetical protein